MLPPQPVKRSSFYLCQTPKIGISPEVAERQLRLSSPATVVYAQHSTAQAGGHMGTSKTAIIRPHIVRGGTVGYLAKKIIEGMVKFNKSIMSSIRSIVEQPPGASRWLNFRWKQSLLCSCVNWYSTTSCDHTTVVPAKQLLIPGIISYDRGFPYTQSPCNTLSQLMMMMLLSANN